MNYKLGVILLIDLCVLLWQNSFLSISVYELNELRESTLNGLFANFALSVFGNENIRFAYIILHILSNILLYKISIKYLKNNAYISNIIFNLTPGSLASALLINPAGIIIFTSLLLVYLAMKRQFYIFYGVLIACIYIDKAMISLYIACIFYAYFNRLSKLLILSILLMFATFIMYGYDFSGRPRGYFLDSLAIMSAVFSPPLFLYFFYTIYYISFKGKKDLLYCISASAFIICLLLSFRQKPEITDFLPFLLPAIPLIIANFLTSFKVHLPQFRAKHNVILFFVLISLVISFLFLIFNPFLYRFVDENEHFAKNYHLNKELAKELKSQGINEISVRNDNFKVLEFYGILPCYQNCKTITPCEKGNININFFAKEFSFCLKNEI